MTQAIGSILTQKRWMIWIMLLIWMSVLSGCGDDNSRDTGPKTYGHDGYMGLSNSNPNLPNNMHYYSYTNDFNFMEEKLRQLAGVADVHFINRDPHIYVHLVPDRALSDSQVHALADDAQSMLQFNMPRYTIHVKMEQ